MPNYQDAMIYTIRSLSREDLIYIGSTCQPLSKRFHGHKHSSSRCSSRQIIDLNDSYIELYENFPCDSKNELHKREGEIIRLLDCVNKRVAGRDRKQYLVDNKIKLQNQMKQYCLNNIIHKQSYDKQYRDDNKIKKQNQMKQYRDDNKNKLQNQMKQYCDNLRRECVCGGKYIDIPSKSQKHYNSNLHIAWVENFYERLNDNS